MGSKRVVTINEYADEWSVSVRTVRNWMRDKIIPYTKIGRLVRIDPIKADEALEKFERKARS